MKRGALRFHELLLFAALIVLLAMNIAKIVAHKQHNSRTKKIQKTLSSPASTVTSSTSAKMFNDARPTSSETNKLHGSTGTPLEGPHLDLEGKYIPLSSLARDPIGESIASITANEGAKKLERIEAGLPTADKNVLEGGAENTMCFQTPSPRKPTHYMEGAYNLRSFSISFWMRTPPNRSPPCKVPFNNHWFDGCMLVIGAPGAFQSAFWTPGARAYRKRRSRNDFGVSMGSEGQLMFGLGHRSLSIPKIPWKGRVTFGIPKFPVYKADVYAGEDHTMHTITKVNDGRWHHVVVERNASHYELVIYIDGIPHTCTNGRGRCVGNLTNHARLTDTYFRAGLGWGFDGCLRDIQLHAAASLAALEHYEGFDTKARDDIDGSLGPSVVLRIKESTARKVGPYPMFYYYIANNDSVWLHRNFRESIKSSGNEGALILNPMSAGDAIFHGARWSFKLNMILQALRSQALGSIIIISDIDIVYFRPIAPIIS